MLRRIGNKGPKENKQQKTFSDTFKNSRRLTLYRPMFLSYRNQSG